MQVWFLSREDLLEEGIATHSSILAWRIPWTEETGGPQSVGLHRVRQNWGDLACVPFPFGNQKYVFYICDSNSVFVNKFIYTIFLIPHISDIIWYLYWVK